MSKSKIIYVPQGCFAEITRETPKNIIGLMTSKINTCCHVIVHNKTTGYLCLCHADAIMDVANKLTGLPAWIKKACPALDYENLRVYVGETDTQKRYEAARGLSYLEQVKNSLNKINQNILLITSYNPELYGVFIERSGVLIERNSNRNPSTLNITFLSADKDTAKAQVSRIYNDSIEIAELELEGKEFETPFVAARAYSLERIAQKLNQRPGGKAISHPFGKITYIQDLPEHLGGSATSDIKASHSDIKLRPISIFDSLTGTLQEAKDIMDENRFINPNRVRRNNEFDDESSGEKYQYYESGSDKDSSNSDSEAKENRQSKSNSITSLLDNIQNSKVGKYWEDKWEIEEVKEISEEKYSEDRLDNDFYKSESIPKKRTFFDSLPFTELSRNFDDKWEVQDNKNASDDETKHLVRTEKKYIPLKMNPKFIDILLEGKPSEEKELITSLRNYYQHELEQVKLEHNNKFYYNKPIILITENNHKIDHNKNAQKLIQMIDGGKISRNTVICLERKEQGENFGMQDVRLLANLIEHNQNNPEEKISISEKIQNSLIYQDALLYNAARKNGIEVMGIEGKSLKYSKESPEYNSAREDYMADQIKEINASARSVIFPVGADHIDGLKERLPLAQVYGKLDTAIEVENIKNTLLQKTTGLSTSSVLGRIKPRSRSLTI